MTTDCHQCRHYQGGLSRVVVDNRTADEWEEWDCDISDQMTDDELAMDVCPRFTPYTPEEIERMEAEEAAYNAELAAFYAEDALRPSQPLKPVMRC
jgi:hypothetical protein